MATTITITNEPKQAFNYSLGDNLIEFELEFLTTVQRWQMSIVYNDEIVVNGMYLSADTLQLKGYELPFDIYIEDLEGIGISPYAIDNFSLGYYAFNILDNIDMEFIRGYEVKV